MILDGSQTCRFPYTTKTITIIYELLKYNLPYDIIRYIWNYYELVPPGLFNDILQVVLSNSNGPYGSVSKTSICRNMDAYRNNILYINMTNIMTTYECKNKGKVMFRLKGNGVAFLNYLKLLDMFMIEKIKNENMTDYSYNLFSNRGLYFEVKMSKVKFGKVGFQKYFNSIKNIGMFFKVYIVRNDIHRSYDVVFKIKALEYVDLK